MNGDNPRKAVYMAIGEQDKVFADYAKAIETDPKSVVPYLHRANAYIELKDFKNASKDAKKACDLNDEECDLYYELKKKKLYVE